MKTVGGSRNRHVVMCIIIVCLSMQRLDHRMMRALGNSAVAFTISFFLCTCLLQDVHLCCQERGRWRLSGALQKNVDVQVFCVIYSVKIDYSVCIYITTLKCTRHLHSV